MTPMESDRSEGRRTLLAWFQTLMGRMVAYYLVLSLIMVSLAGYLALVLSTRTIEESVFERLRLAADLKENALRVWLDERFGDVVLLSMSSELIEPVEQSVAYPEASLQARRARHELTRFLGQVLVAKPGFDKVFVLSYDDARIMASSDQLDIGGFRMYARYFKQGRFGPFIQDVYPSPETGRPAITIAAPIKNRSGAILAVLAAHLDLERMDWLMAQRPGESGETYLVDRFNVFISGQRFGRQTFPRGVHSPGIDGAIQGRSGEGLYRNYAGEPVIAVYRWLEETHLALLIEIPQAQAFAPARRLAWTIFWVGLASVAALSIGVFFLARWIARPIQAIANAAREVGRGRLDQTAPVLVGGEIGVLATVFNQMTRDLARTLEELRLNADKYRHLFDNAPDGIVIARPGGRVVSANPTFLNMFRLTVLDEMAGRSFWDLFAAGPDAEKTLENMNIEGARPSFEADMKDPGGRTFRAGVSMSGITYENQAAVQAVIRDVTRLREAERELRRTRDYLRSVIDSMPSIIIGADGEGRITQWNRKASQATGQSPEAAAGRLLEEVLPGPVIRSEEVAQAIKAQKERKLERVPVAWGTDPRILDVTISPLMAEDISGAVIRVDDVTSRARIDELMVQTEKMISVGGLAAGMAHEINNPLGGILQSAEMMARRLSPKDPRNAEAARKSGTTIEALEAYLADRRIDFFLEGIRECGLRAARIVRDMLGFSRRSEGRKNSVNLAEVLDKAVDLAASDYDLKKLYDFRRISVVKEYQPGVASVVCEPGKIEQVILNLLKNAAQALYEAPASDGLPTIRLRLWQEDQRVRIEVADNGPGMDEDTRRRIFEPFFTTKPVGIGTGLGLSVSYFIITENHQGTLEVDSAPGRGTRFFISLPLE